MRGWIDNGSKEMANTNSMHAQRKFIKRFNSKEWTGQVNGSFRSCGNVFGWWEIEPRLVRVANGVGNRVDRLKAIGNGQVSKVAATAFSKLKENDRE